MKYLYLLLIIIIFSTLLSCKKEGLPDPPPCTNCHTDTLLVWKHDMDTLTGEESLFADPIVYNGNPVFMIFDQWDCSFGSANRVTCIEAGTGTKLWGFDLDDPCIVIHNGYIYDNYLVLNITRKVLCIDLISKEQIWDYNIPSDLQGSRGFYGIGNKVYLSMFGRDILYPEVSFLMEFDIMSGSYREICQFDKLDTGGYPSVHPPSLWVDPSTGDSLLLVAVGLYDHGKGPMAARHTLHAYDLKTNTYRWQVDSIGIPSNNNKRVEVYDNKVYVLTDYRMQCFDAFDGTKLWEYVLDKYTQYVSSFAFSRPLAIKGKVIVNPTGDDMYCLDANTGNLIWSIPEYAASANNDIIEHNGVIYLSSGGYGRFIGVDLETGKIVLNLRSPNKSTHFAGYNVVLNKEKNLLFLNDFKSAFAYRPVR